MAEEEKNITCRKATQADAKLIFDWSNDPLVRAQSFNSAEIVWENHVKWFEKKLQSTTDLLLIALVNNEPAGLVRFENINQKTTIGVLLDDAFRGKGLSSKIILGATDYYFSEHSGPISAFIKAENLASVKAFQKSGFTFVQQLEINHLPSVEYVLAKHF